LEPEMLVVIVGMVEGGGGSEGAGIASRLVGTKMFQV
jgi:hypothetical protein